MAPVGAKLLREAAPTRRVPPHRMQGPRRPAPFHGKASPLLPSELRRAARGPLTVRAVESAHQTHAFFTGGPVMNRWFPHLVSILVLSVATRAAEGQAQFTAR